MQEMLLYRRDHVRPWLRPVFFGLGLASLGIGIVGVWLPLLPGTGFLLLAAYFFSRSSERFHLWLVNHPRFGSLIRSLQEGNGIPRSAKLVAVASMTVATVISAVYVAPNALIGVVIGAVGLIGVWYVLRLPTAVASPSG